MDKERWYWWLLNAWMIALGMTLTWLTILPVLSRGNDLSSSARACILALMPALTAIVGYARTPLTSRKVDGRLPILNWLALIYLEAWRAVWRNRWLLGLVGLIALVQVIGYLYGALLYQLHMPEITRHLRDSPIDFPFATLPFSEKALIELKQSVGDAGASVIQWFFPGIQSNSLVAVQIGIISLAMASAVLWTGMIFRRLSPSPDYSKGLALLRRISSPLVLICAAVFAGDLIVQTRLQSVFDPDPGITSLYAAVHAVYSFVFIAANGFVIAGFAGSLKRTGEGQSVSAVTFVEEAVRFFRPVAGVFMIFTAAHLLVEVPFLFGVRFGEAVPESTVLAVTLFSTLLPLVALGFIFAPFAPVKKSLTAWPALAESLRAWRRSAWDILSMIAVGYSLLIVPTIIVKLARSVFTPPIPVSLALGLLTAIIGTLLGVVTMVAVWKFYQSIGEESTETEEQ